MDTFLTLLLIYVTLAQKIVIFAQVQRIVKVVLLIITFFQTTLLVLMSQVAHKDILQILLQILVAVKKKYNIIFPFFSFYYIIFI